MREVKVTIAVEDYGKFSIEEYFNLVSLNSIGGDPIITVSRHKDEDPTVEKQLKDEDCEYIYGIFEKVGIKPTILWSYLIRYVPLEEEYGKNSYRFSLIERNEDFAIYRQMFHDEDYESNTFEVFRVKKNKADTVFGKKYPARESVPSNEEWGVLGFTIIGLDKAKLKMAELSERYEVYKSAQEN